MIVPLGPEHEPEAEALLDAEVTGRFQHRRGEVVDVLSLPGFVAVEADEVAGVVTFAPRGAEAEVSVLAVARAHRARGVGAGLLEAALDDLRRRRVGRVWLVTTNDNLTALALYQRRGFRLVELRAGAVDRSRERKPEIPLVAANGIPLHDELVLERLLDG